MDPEKFRGQKTPKITSIRGRMVTHVACTNPKCPRYGVAKSVVSAMVLRMDEKVCPQCGSPNKIVRQINTTSKGGGTKRSGKRSSYRKSGGRK